MSDKHDMMTKGFETWKKLAITRIGVNATGVAEDKKENLFLLLEAAFEAGFSLGGSVAEHRLMSELKEAFDEKNGKAIVLNGGIPQPDHGHA